MSISLNIRAGAARRRMRVVTITLVQERRTERAVDAVQRFLELCFSDYRRRLASQAAAGHRVSPIEG